MPIEKVNSVAKFDELLKASQVAIVDFFATWCGPCKQVAPKFHALSDEFTGIKFVQVDVDQLEELSERESVTSMPTFKVYVYGEVKKTIVGSKIEAIRAAIEEIAEIENIPLRLAVSSSSTDTPAATTSTTDAATVAAPSTSTATATATPAPAASSSSSGSYGTVREFESADTFEAEIQKSHVVVDFYASWCGPCKQVAPKFKELASKYNNIPFIKIDVSEVEEIGDKYGISSMPTFGFFKDGKLINTVVGTKIEAIENAVQELINA